MSDLVQVPADFRIYSAVGFEFVKSGEALQRGMPVYLDSTTEQYFRGDSSDATKAKIRGFVGSPTSGADETFQLITSGKIGFGVALEVGKPYILGAGLGGVAPIDDLAVGMFPTILGFSVDADIFQIGITASSIAVA